MKKVFLYCCIVFLIVGCAVKMPQISTYLITSPPARAALSNSHRTPLTLLISPIIANAGYNKKQMMYLTHRNHLSHFAYHEWVAPPAEMLTPLIAERIQDTGYFRAVLISPFIGKTDYRLDVRLVVLQQEFLLSTSQERCVIQATLVNVKTKNVVASHRFQAIVPAPGKNPESGVSAANQAVNQITQQLAQFVVSSLQNHE